MRMKIDPPPTREALHAGPPTTPRQSASVILLRDRKEDELELLLVKRSPAQRFMGGVWVFPGGAVDANEGEGDQAHRAAAVRELREEAGVDGIDAAQLVKYSRWITPEHIKTRFDTHFFLAVAPPDTEARCDGVETVDARWMSPRAALEAYQHGELALVFPTIKHLEALAGFARVSDLLDDARGREVRAVLPRVVFSGGDARVVLPDEPGYDDA